MGLRKAALRLEKMMKSKAVAAFERQSLAVYYNTREAS